MKDLIAVKRVGRAKPGDSFRVSAAEARALVLLGLATYAPKVAPSPPKAAVSATIAPKPRREYLRRDLVAQSNYKPE